MMYGYYDYGFSPFHILGSIFMVLFWVFLLIVLLRFLRSDRGHGHWSRWHDGSHSEAKPVDILKERYAKGEITREEFHAMKKEVE